MSRIIAVASWAGLLLAQQGVGPVETGGFAGFRWPSEPPAGCPFRKSEAIAGIEFTGRWARYTTADTWYPSWASDGNLYSPWTDGKVGGLGCTSAGPGAATGHATILGGDPLALRIVDFAVFKGAPAPYGGRYPCGSLVYNGVWYYGTYCLADTDGDPGKGLNWDVLGPFVGFRYSLDRGKTWTDTPHTPARPLFGEPQPPGASVKIGAPHFVDFGRNLRYSPDGKAYLVAHGASDPDPAPRPANASWITGDQIYLLRVTPSPARINDRSQYEFFGGHDDKGNPVWTRRFEHIKPLVDWNNHCGNVSMTYLPRLNRYLLFITDGGNTVSRFHTYVLESGHITGPWKLVAFMKNFGEQAYFVNLPSKFLGPDGRRGWLCYAANFTNGYLKTNYKANPPGSGYGLVLQEIRFPVK